MAFRACGRVVLGLVAAAALAAAGCGQADDNIGRGKEKGKPVSVAEAKKGGKEAHNYKGRDWCAEHGLPESVCAECNPKVAAEFKKKGDWCDEHDRPKSQCFKCDPKLKEKFAADYKCKYGEDPPPTEDEAPKQEDQGAKKESKK